MADPRPGLPGDGDVDEERLALAMAALLSNAWPDDSGDNGGLPAFTLPPPRRFDAGDEQVVEPAADVAAAAAGDPWTEADVVPPDPWASIDESTQAHMWSAVDDVPASDPASTGSAASSDAPAPADDWWAASEDTSVTPLGAAEEGQPVPPGPVWPTGDPWTNEPLQPAGSGSEPEDQAALEHAGLAGPMNAALSDLRRVGGAEPDVTELAGPLGAGAGAFSGSGKLSELHDWWSERGREVLPGLAVAAVIVLAFAVVLLGRDSGTDGSKVDTGAVVATTAVPTTSPDLSIASEPAIDPTIEDPLFSESTPAAGPVTPATRKSNTATTRRPSTGAPAAGPDPSAGSPGGSTDTTAPTETTEPPPTITTTPTTEPDPTTTTTAASPPADEDRSAICARLPPDRQDSCLRPETG